MTLPQKTWPLDTAPVLADAAVSLGGGFTRPGDLAGFQAIAALLPKLCHAGFECPLGDDGPGLDYLHCLRRLEESRYLVEAPFTRGVWRRLRRFGTLWRDGVDGLSRIPNCWLEFDLRDRVATEVPIPSLFVNIPAAGPSEYDATVERVGAALERVRSPATRAAMLRMHEVFGPVSSACETGFWLARPTAAVRMVFAKLRASPEEVMDLLASAGHPDPSILRRAPVPALWPASGSVSVAVDVAGQIAPGCAIELYSLPPGRAFPAETHSRAQRRLLEDLVAAGLCTVRRSALLSRWQGSVRRGEDSDGDARIWLRRGIHHIKLSVKPDRISAKAYLSLSGLALKQERTAHALA